MVIDTSAIVAIALNEPEAPSSYFLAIASDRNGPAANVRVDALSRTKST